MMGFERERKRVTWGTKEVREREKIKGEEVLKICGEVQSSWDV